MRSEAMRISSEPRDEDCPAAVRDAKRRVAARIRIGVHHPEAAISLVRLIRWANALWGKQPNYTALSSLSFV